MSNVKRWGVTIFSRVICPLAARSIGSALQLGINFSLCSQLDSDYMQLCVEDR